MQRGSRIACNVVEGLLRLACNVTAKSMGHLGDSGEGINVTADNVSERDSIGNYGSGIRTAGHFRLIP